MPGYPGDAVPGANPGTVASGAGGEESEPYYPAGDIPGPGAAGPREEIPPASFQGRSQYQDTGYQDTGYQDTGYQDSAYEESGFPDSAPGTYRPGQQP